MVYALSKVKSKTSNLEKKGKDTIWSTSSVCSEQQVSPLLQEPPLKSIPPTEPNSAENFLS